MGWKEKVGRVRMDYLHTDLSGPSVLAGATTIIVNM